ERSSDPRTPKSIPPSFSGSAAPGARAATATGNTRTRRALGFRSRGRSAPPSVPPHLLLTPPPTHLRRLLCSLHSARGPAPPRP
ncbi:unnamed protein product, partial [Rangifer tarandus platyrhynchus]